MQVELFHTSLLVDYGLRNGMQLSLRVPYDRKDIDVRYTTLDGGTFDPPYGDIHHRSERLSGVSDAELFFIVQPARWDGARWRLAAGGGVTLPIGATEEDPVRLGREGREHQHIQFGSGTVDPKLLVQASRRLAWGELGGSVSGRFPLYESSEGFRGPVTIDWSLGPAIAIGTTTLMPQLIGRYQTRARWNGEYDEGTGFVNSGVAARLAIPLLGFVLIPGVYTEVWSHGFEDETFEQGTTWSLSVARVIR
ncbi:MAG TPA: hypothetical protein VMT00_11360 [Thermoanaerobaculia bacterium]|nr:hypothetical protein [Thermoanaerobaculia bacterium]